MTAIFIAHTIEAGDSAAAAARHRPVADFIELTKPRMNAVVVATTAVGYYLAQRGPCDWPRFTLTILGTALTAAGASVLNQLAERDFDALMPRTANRPLPANRVRPADALLFGASLTIGGVAVLDLFVNPLTALLATITFGIYLLLYTPAKRRTSLCTIIGAVPGAIPAAMGFAAATDRITPPAFALFAILFIWQAPHFLAIAILYRADYAGGGFRMLSVTDARLDVTARQLLLYSLALVAATLVPVLLGTSGLIYLCTAVILGIIFFSFGLVLFRHRTR